MTFINAEASNTNVDFKFVKTSQLLLLCFFFLVMAVIFLIYCYDCAQKSSFIQQIRFNNIYIYMVYDVRTQWLINA